MQQFNDENNAILNSYLENTFFTSWRQGNKKTHEHLYNYASLELMVNHRCRLACKYCYMNKYHNDYFYGDSHSSKAILHNTDLLIEWLYRNGYKPDLEIFAGDSIGDPTCRKIIHKIYDAALEGRMVGGFVSAPTNFSWIRFPKQEQDVRLLLEKSEYVSMPFKLSASFDGKYMDEHNRPIKSEAHKYDDEFYDKAFSFVSEHVGTGLHPMVYSNNIECWIDNFLWFQDKMKEYGIPWSALYLLEVRNKEWTVQQTKDYGKFIKFLIKWTYEKVGKSKEALFDFIGKGRGFNILGFPLVTIGRGLPCSIQSTITLRLGNLSIVPCHRLAYKHMDTGRLIVEDNKIVGIEGENIELFLAIQSMVNSESTYCERCLLRGICMGGCLGSQYETIGDCFSPIPTVCRLFHEKMASTLEAYQEIGAFDMFLERCGSDDKVRAILEFKKLMEGYNGLT